MTEEESWERITELLNEALDLPPQRRSEYLRQACEDDERLRRRVDSLLAAFDGAGDFLLKPVFSLRRDAGEDEEEETGDRRRIGPYQLLRQLGHGGMGEVFLAERVDGGFEQQVAVKVLKRGMDSDEILRRFEAERQILAGLTHPNVARLLDGGTTEDGLPYFVMEYVEGLPIDEHCDARNLTTRERVELFRTVCAAVHFAHQNLVVHRDLKPANILVTTDGRPMLLDFGIAKLLRNEPRFFATETLRPAPVTLSYASPEQIGGGAVSTATDTYALGLLLYELLTGHRAQGFDDTTPQRIVEVICDETPPRPSTVVKRLAGDLDNIVMMALRKEPERRFSSVEQLSEDLHRYLVGLPVRSRPDTFVYRTGKFVRRHAWSMAAIATIGVLVLGFAVFSTVQNEEITRKNEEITRQNEEIIRERDHARAVTNFLVEFLRSPDPSRARGRPVTMQEALAAAVSHAESELRDEPEVRAAVLDTIGGVYRNLGLYLDAKPLLEKALALRRRDLGEDSPRVAESLHNLANLERDLGHDEAAEALMHEAIEVQRRAFPQGHQDLARGLNNLAAFLRENQQLEEAASLARESLDMKIRLGEEPLEIATSLNTLGTLMREQGEVDKAEEHYRRSIEIRRTVGEPIDPGLASTLNNLAGLLMNQEDLDAALPLFEEALRIRRQLYNGDHTKLVSSLNNLALLRTLRGELEEAVTLFQETLSMGRRIFEDRDPRMANLRKNHALFLGEMGDFIACIKVVQKALEALPGERRRAEAESIHGGCLAGVGRFEEAEPMLLSSYQRLSEALGEDARRTRQARERIADAYDAWARPDDAAPFRSKP